MRISAIFAVSSGVQVVALTRANAEPVTHAVEPFVTCDVSLYLSRWEVVSLQPADRHQEMALGDAW